MKWRNDTWTPISEINGGKKFKKGDGITLKDINAIFNNLFYLKGN
jgi:hypothetical protein